MARFLPYLIACVIITSIRHDTRVNIEINNNFCSVTLIYGSGCVHALKNPVPTERLNAGLHDIPAKTECFKFRNPPLTTRAVVVVVVGLDHFSQKIHFTEKEIGISHVLRKKKVIIYWLASQLGS